MPIPVAAAQPGPGVAERALLPRRQADGRNSTLVDARPEYATTARSAAEDTPRPARRLWPPSPSDTTVVTPDTVTARSATSSGTGARRTPAAWLIVQRSVTIFAIPTSGDPRVIGREGSRSRWAPSRRQRERRADHRHAAGGRAAVDPVVPAHRHRPGSSRSTTPRLRVGLRSAIRRLRSRRPVDGLPSAPRPARVLATLLPTSARRVERPRDRRRRNINVRRRLSQGATTPVSRDGGTISVLGEPPLGQHRSAAGATAPGPAPAATTRQLHYAYSGSGRSALRHASSTTSAEHAQQPQLAAIPASTASCTRPRRGQRPALLQPSASGQVSSALGRRRVNYGLARRAFTNPSFPVRCTRWTPREPRRESAPLPYFPFTNDNSTYLRFEGRGTSGTTARSPIRGAPSLFATADNDREATLRRLQRAATFPRLLPRPVEGSTRASARGRRSARRRLADDGDRLAAGSPRDPARPRPRALDGFAWCRHSGSRRVAVTFYGRSPTATRTWGPAVR